MSAPSTYFNHHCSSLFLKRCQLAHIQLQMCTNVYSRLRLCHIPDSKSTTNMYPCCTARTYTYTLLPCNIARSIFLGLSLWPPHCLHKFLAHAFANAETCFHARKHPNVSPLQSPSTSKLPGQSCQGWALSSQVCYFLFVSVIPTDATASPHP